MPDFDKVSPDLGPVCKGYQQTMLAGRFEKGTVYFIEWNLGVEYWSGVQSCRQTLE